MISSELIVLEQPDALTQSVPECFAYYIQEFEYYVDAAFMKAKNYKIEYPTIKQVIEAIKEVLQMEDDCGDYGPWADPDLEIPLSECEACGEFEEVTEFLNGEVDDSANPIQSRCEHQYDDSECPYRNEIYEDWRDFRDDCLLNELILQNYLMKLKVPFTDESGRIIGCPQQSIWEAV